jgi:prepilin-type N-terminal cleavage/methylation domain-containing protein
MGRKGFSLLEVIVSASLLSVIFAVATASLIVSRGTLHREMEKREGLMVEFSVAQKLIASLPFHYFPPEEHIVKDDGKFVLAFPVAAGTSVLVVDEQGERVEAQLSDDRKTLFVRIPSTRKVWVHYQGEWEEGKWKVTVSGEFVTENLTPSPIPTAFKRIKVRVASDDILCPPLWFLVVKGR